MQYFSLRHVRKELLFLRHGLGTIKCRIHLHVPVFLCRDQDGFPDLEHVQGHGPARAAGTSFLDCMCDVDQADTAVIGNKAGRTKVMPDLRDLPWDVLVAFMARHIFPAIGLRILYQSISAENVGSLVGILIRHDQG